MPVLVIAQNKGGVGRTTLALELAVGLEFRLGCNIQMVDFCDPQDLRERWTLRGAPTPKLYEGCTVPGLHDLVKGQVPAIPGTFEQVKGEALAASSWLVVDSPSNDSFIATGILEIADFVLIPVSDLSLSVVTAIETAGACKRLNRKFAFVLNRVDPNFDIRLATRLLTGHGPVLKSFVRFSSFFSRADEAGRSGRTSFDAGGNKKARADMLAVVDCLLQELPEETPASTGNQGLG